MAVCVCVLTLELDTRIERGDGCVPTPLAGYSQKTARREKQKADNQQMQFLAKLSTGYDTKGHFHVCVVGVSSPKAWP